MTASLSSSMSLATALIAATPLLGLLASAVYNDHTAD
jgi:hypothetical protein